MEEEEARGHRAAYLQGEQARTDRAYGLARAVRVHHYALELRRNRAHMERDVRADGHIGKARACRNHGGNVLRWEERLVRRSARLHREGSH
jgi:hypothetical protein